MKMTNLLLPWRFSLPTRQIPMQIPQWIPSVAQELFLC
jgi:hypothetical protein